MSFILVYSVSINVLIEDIRYLVHSRDNTTNTNSAYCLAAW